MQPVKAPHPNLFPERGTSMYEQRKAAIKAKASASLERMKSITASATAQGRDLTASEVAEVNEARKEAQEQLKQIKSLNNDQDIFNQAKGIADSVGGDVGDRKPGIGRKGWADTAVKALRGGMTNQVTGQKALVSGTMNLNNPVEPGVTTSATAPRTILDLLRDGVVAEQDPYARNDYSGPTPVQQQAGDFFGGAGGGNTFSYLRQTVRDNKAAPVADGALKPTSLYTFEEVEDRYRVIAHLSEPIPQRFFYDDGTLGDFLASEMAGGLEQAIEYQALFGDGTGENLTGILSTSGIKLQTFVTDPITTSRKALTQLQADGVTPSAWAINPADAETFDLLREGATSGQYLLGGPAGDASKVLWTIPTALSMAIPVGTALLADWSQGKLLPRQEATLHVDTSGELFDKNQVKFRVEGRYGLVVKRPGAFVKVSLTGL